MHLYTRLHVSALQSHHQASTEEQIHIRFFVQLGSQEFTVLKYYCLRCMVKLKLLELKWISVCCNKLKYFFLWRCDPALVMASSFLRFLDHTQRRNTIGRTPLDEWSVRRRDLYLTTHDTHKRQTSMPPVGFEPTISAGERTQTYA